MNLIDTVGNTPLLKFEFPKGTLWGKAEFLNPGGSVKDRPVAWILKEAIRTKKLKRGDTIVEATSGNMGISLAMFCANLGFKCIIVMPSNMSTERKTMLKSPAGTSTSSAPNDFNIVLRSVLMLEGITIIHLNPKLAQNIANDMPMLPDVASTIVSPRLSFLVRIASLSIQATGLSFSLRY
jgi:cysteine synthase A